MFSLKNWIHLRISWWSWENFHFAVCFFLSFHVWQKFLIQNIKFENYVFKNNPQGWPQYVQYVKYQKDFKIFQIFDNCKTLIENTKKKYLFRRRKTEAGRPQYGRRWGRGVRFKPFFFHLHNNDHINISLGKGSKSPVMEKFR